jgi:hypothetical protein
MDIEKLYCMVRFPQCWEEEYEERTGILASLESLDRVADKNPKRIYMTPKQMAEFKRTKIFTMKPETDIAFFDGIQIEVKND